jgi:aminopyrrolnitrin oxygenase
MRLSQPTIEPAVPRLPASWYLACASRALRRGGIVTTRLLDEDVVVYRTQKGGVNAVHARCTHMGASLAGGEVTGEGLRCPMHHRVYMPPAAGPDPGSRCLRQRTYPVLERNGAVFVFAGERATFECPQAAEGERSVVVDGRAQLLSTSWANLICNAFDIEHMQAVHGRAMKEPPEVTVVDRHLLELRYVSRVTGTAVSDRVMKMLSDDTIRVTIRCWGGTLLTIHSRVGRMVSHLLLCITPTAAGSVVVPFIAVPRGSVPLAAALRAQCSGWFFLTFLKRDLQPLEGMRLNLAQAVRERGPLGICARWLTDLPEAAISPSPDTENRCDREPQVRAVASRA